MKAIWKWTLQDRSVIDMPVGSKVLAVQGQNGFTQLWALVNPAEKQLEQRIFNVYATGGDVPDNPGQYLGTVQVHSSWCLVFHVFEETIP